MVLKELGNETALEVEGGCLLGWGASLMIRDCLSRNTDLEACLATTLGLACPSAWLALQQPSLLASGCVLPGPCACMCEVPVSA